MQAYFQGFETLKHTTTYQPLTAKNFSENQEVLVTYLCVPVLFRKRYN